MVIEKIFSTLWQFINTHSNMPSGPNSAGRILHSQRVNRIIGSGNGRSAVSTRLKSRWDLGNVGLGKQHDLRPRAIAVAFNSLDEAVRVPIDAVGASLSRRPRGAMARSSHVIALPWYHRRDYTALLMMVSDPQNLPATYDAWLERAEATERQFQKADFDVVRVWIRPVPSRRGARSETIFLASWRA
jgi:hypothetical protein